MISWLNHIRLNVHKIVKRTLKTFKQMLQDFWRKFEHFIDTRRCRINNSCLEIPKTFLPQAKSSSRKTKISQHLSCTRMFAYQRVRNAKFSENFAYVNCLSVFDNFIKLTLKGLIQSCNWSNLKFYTIWFFHSIIWDHN